MKLTAVTFLCLSKSCQTEKVMVDVAACIHILKMINKTVGNKLYKQSKHEIDVHDRRQPLSLILHDFDTFYFNWDGSRWYLVMLSIKSYPTLAS